MRLRALPLTAVLLVMTTSNHPGVSQAPSERRILDQTVVDSSLESTSSVDLSSDDRGGVEPAAAFVRSVPSGTNASKPFHPFSRIGIDSHTGSGGVGFDVATPLSRSFNVRAGSDFFNYATSFQEEGANIAVSLHMEAAHASLDWYPFGGRFRLSPLVVFANNNRVQATVLIPAGSSVTLSGQNFISSFSDPLHGNGSIGFRKVSPGFSLGLGNIIPRRESHFSVPFEVGFYYVGQPGLKVNFSGSACDPTQPAAVGCQSVTQDAEFQQNLGAFIARNNHNLSYASFLPILSTGIGYSF